MRKTSLLVLLALTVSVSFYMTSCSIEETETDKFVSLDLAPLHGVARKYMDSGSIDLDSPQLVEMHFERGWSEPYSVEGEDSTYLIAAMEEEAVFRYRVLEPADRWLSFRIGLSGEYGNLEKQRVEILWNERNILHTAEIRAGEDEQKRFFIPASLQQRGVNKLHFRFSEYSANPDFESSTRRARRRQEYPGIAAYFSHFKFFLGDEQGPSSSELRSETEVIRQLADTRVLGQFPDSRLEYAFEIRPGAELSIAGRAQSPEGAEESIALNISALTDDSGHWQELWRADYSFESIGGSKPFSADLPLDELAGKAARLLFSVMSDSPSKSAGVIWQKLALTFPKETREPATTPGRAPVRMKDRVNNVVIIVMDALRFDMLGCYGNQEGMTPGMDEFAADSLVFRHAIAPAPYTIASTSSLFSSLLPESHGVRDGLDVFPEDIPNLARTLKENGYYTAALSGAPFITRKYGITRDCDLEVYLREDEAKEVGISTMDLGKVEEGVKQVAASGKPAFIYFHYLPPHWPYRPPAPFDKKYIDSSVVTNEYRKRIRTFKGDSESEEVKELLLHYKNNLVYADHVFRQTLEMLKRHGLYENSLVILTADHGEAFAEHGALEHGNTVYDEMIRIPMIVRVPGRQAREITQQIGSIDFFPTFVELLDLRLEGEPLFEGRSIAPLLAGNDMPPAGFYFSRASGERLKFCLRGERYKYIFTDYSDELYDLENDPLERENVAGNMPALTAALRQQGLLLVATNSARRGGERQEVELTEEEERELRNLGYLQ